MAAVGSPNGNRTRVSAVRGRCPRPLDDGTAAIFISQRSDGVKGRNRGCLVKGDFSALAARVVPGVVCPSGRVSQRSGSGQPVLGPVQVLGGIEVEKTPAFRVQGEY